MAAKKRQSSGLFLVFAILLLSSTLSFSADPIYIEIYPALKFGAEQMEPGFHVSQIDFRNV